MIFDIQHGFVGICIIGSDGGLSIRSDEELRSEENLAMKINKSKIQLYRYMQLCYGSSVNTLKYLKTENFGEVVTFVCSIEKLMVEDLEKYSVMLCSPSFSKYMYKMKFKEMLYDLCRLENECERVQLNVVKDASVMWCISSNRIPQSALLYYALHRLQFTKANLLGEYLAKFESGLLTKLLRTLYSVKLVCKTWKHMKQLLFTFLGINKDVQSDDLLMFNRGRER